jgi:hypothetical protein
MIFMKANMARLITAWRIRRTVLLGHKPFFYRLMRFDRRVTTNLKTSDQVQGDKILNCHAGSDPASLFVCSFFSARIAWHSIIIALITATVCIPLIKAFCATLISDSLNPVE